ncbi:glutathione S-transferase T2-like [Capsella rubella]|uniref:glutathione S-transferase T2-like n=1 Tax=Capsella rubella TaxID=81985 RepID=UPI000CD59E80|nr:glutathione S-transferase T2-like [Capsella rubella]
MDSYNPYPHSSSYLELLNSQLDNQNQQNSNESFPPEAYNLASEGPAWSSQPSIGTPSDGTPAMSSQTPVTVKDRKKWNPCDDEVLISAWLNTSKDTIVGNQQKGGSFWHRVAEYYASSPSSTESGEQGLKVNCKQRWHKINEFTNKFCGSFATAERQNTSGHSDNDVLKVAHAIYYSDYKTRFNLEHCWCLLRYEQKWITLNTINSGTPTGRSKRKPTEEGSQTATSIEEECEVRPEGVKAAKAKRTNGQGKALIEYKSMWDIKKEEMAETEKLQKLAILDTILAKKDPLSSADELIKSRIVAQYF